jgi:integrase/recombinase XerD
MTSLRRRMTEDMQVRNLSSQTQATYVQQVSLFARHFNKSPEIVRRNLDRSLVVHHVSSVQRSAVKILLRGCLRSSR